MKSEWLTKRRLALGVALLASVILAVGAPEKAPDAVIQAVERPGAGAQSRAAEMVSNESDPGRLASLLPRELSNDLPVLFSAPGIAEKSRKGRQADADGDGQPDAPVNAEAALQAAPRPSAPVLPPLPFRYIGRMRDQERMILFLGQGDQNLIVRQGDTIDGAYRVEAIEESYAEFTYLPLRKTQRLLIGATS